MSTTHLSRDHDRGREGWQKPTLNGAKPFVSPSLVSKFFENRTLRGIFCYRGDSSDFAERGRGVATPFLARVGDLPLIAATAHNFISSSNPQGEDRQPQIRYAPGSPSLATPRARTGARPPGKREAAEAHSRLRIVRSRRRDSLRSAKSFAADCAERPDSQLHLRRKLVQVGRCRMEASAVESRTEERFRPRPRQPWNHDRPTVIVFDRSNLILESHRGCLRNEHRSRRNDWAGATRHFGFSCHVSATHRI